MEIADTIEKLEDAPENFREFYVKNKDGKFDFNPSLAVAGVKKNRDDILSEKRTIQEKYKDIDLDAYNKWRDEEAQRKTKEQKDQNDWDARESSLKDAHNKELQKEKDRNNRIFASLDKQLIENTSLAALNEANVIPTKVKLLMPHIKSQLKVIEVDGDFVARVVGSDGKVRYQNGSEMTIAQLVAELKADDAFSDCFKAETAKGSATTQTAQVNPRKDGPTGKETQGAVSNPVERLKGIRRTAAAKR